MPDCPECGTDVYVKSDGTCPRCGHVIRDPDSVTPTTDATEPADEQQEPTEEKPEFEVYASSGDTRIVDSLAALREEILKGTIDRSYSVRSIKRASDGSVADADWSTLVQFAGNHPGLRALYRPVWDTTIRYRWYGIITGVALKAIHTTVTIFAVDERVGFIWLAVVASLLLAKKWPLAPIAAIYLSFKSGVRANLFVTALTTALLGAVFGAPAGMIVGTIVGHFRKNQPSLASDAESEGARPYILGIVMPLLFLVLAALGYLWLQVKIVEWLS